MILSVREEIVSDRSERVPSQYIQVGTNWRSRLRQGAMVVRMEMTDRGICLFLEPILQHSGRFRLLTASFDDLEQSSALIAMMRVFGLIKAAYASASRAPRAFHST